MWVSQVPNTPTWRICNPFSWQQRRHVKKLLFKISTPITINICSEIEVTAEFTAISQEKVYFCFQKNTKFDLLLLSGHHEPQVREIWQQKKILNQTFFFSSKMSILEKIEKGVCYSEQSQKWMVGTTISKNEFLINVWWELRQ